MASCPVKTGLWPDKWPVYGQKLFAGLHATLLYIAMYFSSNKHAVLLISTLLYYSLPFSKLQLYCTVLCSTLCYTMLCYSTLYGNVSSSNKHAVLLISTLLYFSLLFSKLQLYCTVLCSTLCYTMLCYSTLYSNVFFPQINIYSPSDFVCIWLSLQPSFHHVSIRLHTGWVVLMCIKHWDITGLWWFSFYKQYLELSMR